MGIDMDDFVNHSAAEMTETLADIGDGNMGNGIINIHMDGIEKGQLEGLGCGIAGTLIVFEVINLILKRRNAKLKRKYCAAMPPDQELKEAFLAKDKQEIKSTV